jgi:hypothetical protein
MAASTGAMTDGTTRRIPRPLKPTDWVGQSGQRLVDILDCDIVFDQMVLKPEIMQLKAESSILDALSVL